MAIKSCSEGSSWRLRTGQPVLMCGCPCKITPGTVYYVMQTFGGEEREVRNFRATTELLESSDFIGINPEGEFEGANYSASQYVTSDGDIVFTGQERKIVNYINEDDVPGVEAFTFI
jgi:hypothetical protein